MPKQAWTFVGIFTALFLCGAIGLYSLSLKRDLAETQKQTEEARAAITKQKVEMEEIHQRAALQAERIEELKRERDAVEMAQKSLENEMRNALESKDVTISELQGKLTVNILDRILFDSGEATLKPEGEKVLEQIAGVLAQYPKRQIHVVGHTDNVPIRAGARVRFATNWELSAARAMAAVRFLSERAGVDPKRLGALAYGEYRPIAENSTPEGRARNRRIAVVVLSDEVVGLDSTNALPAKVVLPGAEPIGTTNSPGLEPPQPTNGTSGTP
jgi:chemotaxis protein MotB